MLSPVFHPHVHTFLKYKIKCKETIMHMHWELTKMFNNVRDKILDYKIHPSFLNSICSCYHVGMHYCK